MQHSDRINEAYDGLMGGRFQDQTRMRINWILEQTKNCEKVLDVGCSQGIVSLLLAQQGKFVLGIDINEHAITYANEKLNSNHKELIANLKYLQKDFISLETDNKFDCVIIGEVLEHIEEPEVFLEKAQEVMKKDGLLIVTVPFGLSKHPDHYATYYLGSFYQLISRSFYIMSYAFISRWIGLVAVKNSDKYLVEPLQITDYLKQEAYFLSLEQDAQAIIDDLGGKLREANGKYREASGRNKQLGQKLSDVNVKYREANEYIKDLGQKLSEANDKYRESSEKNRYLGQRLNEANDKYRLSAEAYNKLNEKYKESEKRLDELSKELTEAIYSIDTINKLNHEYTEELKKYIQETNREIETLSQMNRLFSSQQVQIASLKQENEQYLRKLSQITDTWYGKIAVVCYRRLKMLKRRITSIGGK